MGNRDLLQSVPHQADRAKGEHRCGRWSRSPGGDPSLPRSYECSYEIAQPVAGSRRRCHIFSAKCVPSGLGDTSGDNDDSHATVQRRVTGRTYNAPVHPDRNQQRRDGWPVFSGIAPISSSLAPGAQGLSSTTSSREISPVYRPAWADIFDSQSESTESQDIESECSSRRVSFSPTVDVVEFQVEFDEAEMQQPCSEPRNRQRAGRKWNRAEHHGGDSQDYKEQTLEQVLESAAGKLRKYVELSHRWQLPRPTAQQLEHGIDRLGDPGIFFYTDGSAELDADARPSAGWGIAILVQFHDRAELIGVAAGHVAMLCHECGYLGAHKATNNTGEHSAFAWALAIARTLPIKVPITIRYDSTHAADAALRRQRVSANVDLVETSRALAWRIQQLWNFTEQHVYGHSEDPWNELADWAAKAGKDRYVATVIAGLLDDRVKLVEAYRARADDSAQPSVDQVRDHLRLLAGNDDLDPLWVRDKQGFISLPTHILFKARAVHGGGVLARAVQLLCISANVLTLHPRELRKRYVGLRETGRIAILQNQFYRHRVAMAGLQEARTDKSTRVQANYLVLSGGGTTGNLLGCELWLSLRILRITINEVNTIDSSPRHLLVAIRAKLLVCNVLVGHAPQSDDPDKTASARWWRDITIVVRKYCDPDIPLLYLFDTNGTVGSTLSTAIGPRYQQEQNENGELFHQLLLETASYVPATFGQQRLVSEHTWTSTAHTTKRMDYVAGPLAWATSLQWAGVLPSIDLALKREDHRVAAALFRISKVARTERLVRRRMPRLDLQLMACPERVALFQQAVQQIPAIPERLSVDAHHFILVKRIREVAVRFFSSRTKSPVKPWIAAETFAFIAMARRNRKAAEVYLRAACLAMAIMAIAAWRWANSRMATWSRAVRTFTHHSERKAFLAWKQCRNDWAAPVSVAFAMQLAAPAFRGYAFISASVLPMLARITKMVKADKKAFVGDIALSAQRASQAGDSKALFASVNKLRAFKGRHLPAIQLEDGQPAISPVDTRARWQRHFRDLLKGDIAPLAEIAQHSMQRIADREQPPSAIELLPTLDAVEDLFRCAKAGKATGEDGLAPGLFKVAPTQLAIFVYPLLAKCFRRVQAPLRWKGGLWQEIYKKKGAMDLCASFRGVLVSDFLSKTLSRIGRVSMSAILPRVARDTQVGGIQHKGTEFGFHITRSFTEWVRHARRYGGLLFIDFRAAFDSVIRQLVFGAGTDDIPLLRLLQRLGIPHKLQEVLQHADRARSTLDFQGMSPPVVEMLKELHTDTWFSTDGLSDVVETQLGTKPGDPLGDIAFNFFAADFFTEVAERAAGAGIATTFPFAPAAGPFQPKGPQAEMDTATIDNVSYVDDGMLMAVADSPEQLCAHLQTLAEVLVLSSQSRGIEVNFEPGKTEAMLLWRSAALYQSPRILREPNGARYMQVYQHRMRLGAQYKHLGSVATDTGHMGAEVANRVNGMLAAWMPLEKTVFAAEQIARQVRLRLAAALLFATLLYGAATWSPLPDHLVRRLESARLRAVRRIDGQVGHKNQHAISDQRLVAKYGLDSMEGLMRRLRLMYLPRLVNAAPRILLSLLQGAGDPSWQSSWAEQMVDDLEVLHAASGKLEHLPSPRHSTAEWVDLVRTSPKQWKTIVSKVKRFGAGRIQQPQPQLDHQPAVKCPHCDQWFDTHAERQSHAASAHKDRRIERFFIGADAVCPICTKGYGTRIRAIRHLCYSAVVCQRGFLYHQGEPLHPETVKLLDAKDAAFISRCRKKGIGYMRADAHILCPY